MQLTFLRYSPSWMNGYVFRHVYSNPSVLFILPSIPFFIMIAALIMIVMNLF
jgi:hypothetical protein